MNKRINEDELDYEDGQLCSYKSKPYTGQACEYYANGALRSEVNYVDGMQEEVSRDYYPNGSKMSERTFATNGLHGLSKEWYETGARKSEANYECGIELNYTEWDEKGIEIKNRKLDKKSTQYRLLMKWRDNQTTRKKPPKQGQN